MIRKNKPKMRGPYWFTGYLIPFNKPQIRYRPFISVQDIMGDGTMQHQPNDYIFRITSSGMIFIYYRFVGGKWKRKSEVLEYEQDIKYTNLTYLQ